MHAGCRRRQRSSLREPSCRVGLAPPLPAKTSVDGCSLLNAGKRRYDRKQSGYGGQTKPVFHKKVRDRISSLRGSAFHWAGGAGAFVSRRCELVSPQLTPPSLCPAGQDHQEDRAEDAVQRLQADMHEAPEGKHRVAHLAEGWLRATGAARSGRWEAAGLHAAGRARGPLRALFGALVGCQPPQALGGCPFAMRRPTSGGSKPGVHCLKQPFRVLRPLLRLVLHPLTCTVWPPLPPPAALHPPQRCKHFEIGGEKRQKGALYG